jgi:hypothetical protein
MKPCERNTTSAKPKKKKKNEGMINLVVEHSHFDKKTQQVDRWCSNQPINWMGAPKIYTSYCMHIL